MRGSARADVLQAAAGLLVTRVCLAVSGVRRFTRATEWLTRSTPRDGGTGTGDLEAARDLERRVAAAARHSPLKTNCLDRALTLWWLLRWRGIAAGVRFGGRKQNGKFEAHAWVEVGGAALDCTDGEPAGFSRFERAAAFKAPAS